VKLSRTTLALVRGSLVAITALGGCGGGTTNTPPAARPVAQVSAPTQAPIAHSDNATTSVSQSTEDYPVDCGRG